MIPNSCELPGHWAKGSRSTLKPRKASELPPDVSGWPSGPRAEGQMIASADGRSLGVQMFSRHICGQLCEKAHSSFSVPPVRRPFHSWVLWRMHFLSLGTATPSQNQFWARSEHVTTGKPLIFPVKVYGHKAADYIMQACAATGLGYRIYYCYRFTSATATNVSLWPEFRTLPPKGSKGRIKNKLCTVILKLNDPH